MKATKFFTMLSALVFFFTFNAFASSGSGPAKAAVNMDAFETNLLVGVSSDNTGLMVSAANFLGEIKSQSAVIPLMRMFNSNMEDGARIAAALALLKIGDGRGIDLIKYASKYDDSEHVRKICSKFYNYYQHEKYSKK